MNYNYILLNKAACRMLKLEVFSLLGNGFVLKLLKAQRI